MAEPRLVTSFHVECEFCGESKKRSSPPPRMALRLLNQPPQHFTVCSDCEKKIKELNKPVEDAEREADLKQAEETKRKMAEKAAQEAAEKPVTSDDAIAQALVMIAQQNAQIIGLLAAKEENGKQPASSRSRRKR